MEPNKSYIPILFVSVIFLLSNLSVFISAHAETPGSEQRNGTAFDPSAPPKTKIHLTPDVSFGASVELKYQLEKNFDLDVGYPDDLTAFEPALSMALSYNPTENFTAFLNIEPSGRFTDVEDGKMEENRLEIKQAYVSFGRMVDLTIKIGRQRLKDRREWLFDEEMDAIRLYYTFSKVTLDFSVSENRQKDLINDGNDEQVTNYVLYGSYTLDKDIEVAGYCFARDDRTEKEESPIFYGLRLNGEASDNLESWLELAHIRGRSGTKKIRGTGLDLGSTYVFNRTLSPSVTFAFASGSGDDDPSDAIDRNFRQTGLQDNDAKFNGIVPLKYYGEMFDPELSNLAIFTSAIGLRPMHETSVDLVYHYYRQHKLSDEIRDSEIDRDPDGLHRELGHEIDLIAGYRLKQQLRANIAIGYFFPGQAFPQYADNALFAEIKLRYDF